MKNNSKNLIIFVSVVLLGTIVFFLARPTVTHDDSNSSESASTTETNQQTKNPEVVAPSPKPASSLDQCIAGVKASASYSQAAKGLIIVSFAKGISFDEAVKIIKSQSLSVEDTADVRNNFASNSFFEISVPKGEEAKWICIFNDLGSLVRARLDVLFNLHE